MSARTLVVSDLHLGSRTGVDVARLARLRAPLLEALAGVERLVLLGDVLELRQAPVHEVLEAARPFFADVASALPSGAQVVLVAGNHDHQLVVPALARHRAGACGSQDGAGGAGGGGAGPAGGDSGVAADDPGIDDPAAPYALALDEALSARDGEPAAQLARWLAPATFELRYPGVWLRPDVYATHGHYLDRHITVPTFERIAIGAMGRFIGAAPPRATPGDYEAALAPIYAWLYAVAQHSSGASPGKLAAGASAVAWRALAGTGGGRAAGLRSRLLGTGFPVAIAALNRVGIGPLGADIGSEELRRASLRAIDDALGALGVEADHVIFGHTHRTGPLPGDDLSEWRAAAGGGGGGAALVNSGSWVYQDHFLSGTQPDNPYWPGRVVWVDAEGPPRLEHLLADRDAADLRG